MTHTTLIAIVIVLVCVGLLFDVTQARETRDLAALIRADIAIEEEQVHTFDDLRAAVAANNDADNAIITVLGDLRTQIANIPTDRPLTADEQAALDDAVDRLTSQTTALVQATTSPGGPVVNGPGGQGAVVDVPPADATPDPATPADPGTVAEPAPTATVTEDGTTPAGA